MHGRFQLVPCGSRSTQYYNFKMGKRKRKIQEVENISKKEAVVDEKKHVKNETSPDEPVAKRLRKDVKIREQTQKKSVLSKNKKRPISKPIKKRRVTKNECICASDEEPEQSQLVEDHEAHVLVAEWRLHKFQSPIELKHDDSIHHDHFEPLEFHGHWDKGGKAFLKNTGKTAVLRFESRELPVLVGGPLHEDTYVFEQLHFHWSADDTSGCEHIFEGRAYSMEAHAVHYNTKYADFDEAHDKPDGLAVVGFFLEATDNEDNPCFNKLTNAVKKIVEIGSMTCVPTDCLTWIKEEAQCKGYYTYQGSLTTEPYTESVTWILYPTPIHVSREQVAYFRNMKSNEKTTIVNNVRPLQTPPEHKKLNIIYARSHRKSE